MSAAVVAAYAFLCELYLFTVATTSISVQWLLLSRGKSLQRGEIEQRYSGRSMVARRFQRLVSTGLLEKQADAYRPTPSGFIGRRIDVCPASWPGYNPPGSEHSNQRPSGVQTPERISRDTTAAADANR